MTAAGVLPATSHAAFAYEDGKTITVQTNEPAPGWTVIAYSDNDSYSTLLVPAAVFHRVCESYLGVPHANP